MLFYLHILKVEEYQKELLVDPKSVDLSRVKGGLPNLLARIKNILEHIDAEILATPAPLQLSHNNLYEKKEYGFGVIAKLKDWLTQVLQVLEEAKEVCTNQTAGIQRFKRALLRSLRKLP